MNNNLSREALTFNKLLYFALKHFYGKGKKIFIYTRKQKRIIHISNRIKVFPFFTATTTEKMCCAKHNNLSSEISFFDWLAYISLHFSVFATWPSEKTVIVDYLVDG